MRRTPVLLIVLGAILLAASGVMRFVVYPDVDQLPSNWNRTVVYAGTGNFVSLAAVERGDTAHAVVTGAPVTVDRHVRVSRTDGSTAVVTDDITVTSGSTQVIAPSNHTWALDRTSLNAAPAPSGVAVDPHQGVTIGFPVNVSPQDYTYWDTYTQTTVPARYLGTETHAGRESYVYGVTAAGRVRDPSTLSGLPQALPKSLLGSVGAFLPAAEQSQLAALAPRLPDPVPLIYTSTNTITAYIDSHTGLPLDVHQSQTVTLNVSTGLRLLSLGPVLSLNVANTQASINQAVNDAQNGETAQLWFGVVGPLVLLVVGVILVLLAIWLQFRRRSGGTPASASSAPTPATSAH